jgi:hypothetical protein
VRIPARALRVLVATSIAGAGAPLSLRAQSQLLATHVAPLRAASGASVTAAIRVTNASRSSLVVVPRISTPEDWSTLLGAFPFTLGPREGDSWLVSLRVPARAAAGRYIVHLAANDSAGRPLMRDSLIVDVQALHAVEIAVAERPAYAISGKPYRAAFIVRNRGNVATTFGLKASSGLGVVLDAPASMSLAAGESRQVAMQTTVITTGQQSSDDLFQLEVRDLADTSVSARSSMRVTIVQRAGTSAPMHTVASTLRVRASDGSAGIAPFELIGGGQLRDGGSEQVEFVARGRTTAGSLFGEREEYRLAVAGDHYRTQLGDGLYMASPLTSGGQAGFGAGLAVGDSTLGAGGFMQRYRFQPTESSEQGMYLRFGGDEIAGAPRLGLNAVDRRGGPIAGQILSGSAKVYPMGAGHMVVDLEYAGSRGPAGSGVARSARVSGGDLLHFDLGHVDADEAFAGPNRGTTSDYANLTTRAWNSLQLLGAIGSFETRGRIAALPYTLQQHTSLLEVMYDGAYSIGYTAVTRNADSYVGGDPQSQRGVVARGSQDVGTGQLWASGEAGTANDAVSGGVHPYEDVSLGATAPVGKHSLSLYGGIAHGDRAIRGADRILTMGMDARLLITPLTSLTVGASDMRTVLPDGEYLQVDARLTRMLSTGASLSMRVRLGGRDFTDPAGQRLAYLEYSTPLQLPIGPSREFGRVRGQVVDQRTGQGVAGALVRLGPQAAITDDEGRVAFAGLPAGAYRVSLAQQLAGGSTVFAGDPNVRVDSARREPATFHVVLEAAGTVSGTVRRLALARTGIGAAPDSLADVGPLEGVSVALAGARDTVYRTTDAAGTFLFTDVPSGSWTVIVLAEPPSQMQWELERVPVVLSAGENRSVTFRLVPRRRKVRIVSGDGIDEGTDR